MSRANRGVGSGMDVNGPYERYYAERADEDTRTTLWPWVPVAVVIPLLLVGLFVVHGEQADATATWQSAPATAIDAADGEYRVGPVLVPGVWVTDGPSEAGAACEYVRTAADGTETARAAMRGPAAAQLVAGATVVFSGGCAWSTR